MSMNRDVHDDDLDFDEGLEDGWLADIELAEVQPTVAGSDAYGRPYRARRRIEEWLEQRALRELDDFDY